MEYEKSGISSEDVKRYALSSNPSTDTQMIDSSNFGEALNTGSTVTRDVHSDATSHNVLSDTDRSGDNSDETERTIGSDEFLRSTSDLSQSEETVGGVIAESKSTENAYGGGLYAGTKDEDVGAPSSKKHTSGHASDFQSAEGLASDMPKHKDVHTLSSGDRAIDVIGQSYIQ